MNELYTQDRMERNNTDYDGSGIGSGHYTPHEEQKEKIGNVMLPFGLLLLAGLCFGILVFLTVRDVDYYMNETVVEGSVISSGKVAYFIGEDGKSHTILIDYLYTKNENGKINVYYKGTDYNNALTITPWWFYMIGYLFFGGAVGLIIFWIYRIMRRSKHSVNFIAESDGYRSKFDE